MQVAEAPGAEPAPSGTGQPSDVPTAPSLAGPIQAALVPELLNAPGSHESDPPSDDAEQDGTETPASPPPALAVMPVVIPVPVPVQSADVAPPNGEGVPTRDPTVPAVRVPAGPDAPLAADPDAPTPPKPAPPTGAASPTPLQPEGETALAPATASPETAAPRSAPAEAARPGPANDPSPTPPTPPSSPKSPPETGAAPAPHPASAKEGAPEPGRESAPEAAGARPADRADRLAQLLHEAGDEPRPSGAPPTGPAGGHGARDLVPAFAATGVAPAHGPMAADPSSAPALVPIAGVAVEIAAQALAGKNRFSIRLDPPDLGRIDVRLDVDRDGRVTSRLVVERVETLDLLRRDAPQLERALQDAGLKTGAGAMQFSLRDQGQQHARQETPERAMRIVVPDQDAPTAEATRLYARQRGRPGGLDIRV